MLKRQLLFSAVVLLGSSAADTCQGPFPMVAVHYLIDEPVAERVEATIINPLEKLLSRTSRLAEMCSMTGHGSAAFELRFDDGATEQDLETIKQRVQRLTLAGGIQVISTKVFLTSSCLSTWPWSED
jgi:multidrug efflux pump subunit AcrB